MAIDPLELKRVMFGTDGSMLNVLIPFKVWVEVPGNPWSVSKAEFSF
ncbi:MAG: hypothetical protein Q6352_011410 [Candidatus Freyrarchaeum guaymaensis]|nr:hypothetical protein [Candidatus Sigynarchaeota archaeon]